MLASCKFVNNQGNYQMGVPTGQTQTFTQSSSYQQPNGQQTTYVKETVQQPSGITKIVVKETVSQPVNNQQSSYSSYGSGINGG